MSQRTRICNCEECFYCYIHQDFFHANNLEKLRAVPLMINVAEYVGPETSQPKDDSASYKLMHIPIKLCTSGHNH